MSTPVEVRGARSASEVGEAYELAARVFGPSYDEARAAKDRILEIEPPADLRDVLVAVSGGAVVGLVRIVDRQAQLGAGVVKIGGITSVAVRGDCRGSGCGRELMDAAIGRSRERGDALSIAFARRAVDGFYWRLGYVGLGAHPRMTCAIATTEGATAVPVATTLRPEWLPTLAAAYGHSYDRQPLRFVRPGAWWASFRARFPWLGDTSVVTVLDGPAPVGYYVTDAGTVIEAASLPGRVGVVRTALLRTAAGGSGELVLSLSPAHPVARSLATVNHTMAVRRAWDGGHVVRAIDRDAILTAIQDQMTEAERAEWLSADLSTHAGARRALMASATGSLSEPPVWSKLDEF